MAYDIPDHVKNATLVQQALKEHGYSTGHTHIEPYEDDELDRYYVHVTFDGVKYEQQFHQKRPTGTGFTGMRYDGFVEDTAVVLDKIATEAMEGDN